MKFSILTLFPEMVYNTINTSITARGIKNGKLNIETVDIRDFSSNKNRRVDDYSYGGGAGMLIEPDCVYKAYVSVAKGVKKRVVYMTPKGKTFNMQMAKDFAKEDELVILCGHYEGIDERVLEEIVTDYVSIGDYVLTGGELAACVIIDATSRFCEGVLGNDESATIESFYGDLLEYPQYTRPEEWHGKSVPKVLLSGNKKEIDAYRLSASEEITKKNRPDLYANYLNKQKIIGKLKKCKKDSVHISELLIRNIGKSIYNDDTNIIVLSDNKKKAFVWCDESENSFIKLIDSIPDNCTLICSVNKAFVDYAKNNGYEVYSTNVQAIYTEKVTKSLKYKDIRPIEQSDIKAFLDNMNTCFDFENADSIQLFGIYDENKLKGFGGINSVGSIDYLYILPEFRNKGYAQSLEGYLINLFLAKGYTPFIQINENLTELINLQNKLKLYFSEKKVYWLCRNWLCRK